MTANVQALTPQPNPRALRDALGAFPTGVTIITTVDQQGRARGITANSFTSVSLDPPLVLVCVARDAESYTAFTQADGYAVNILGQRHQQVAELFATKRPDKFDAVATSISDQGHPLICPSVAWLDCQTTHVQVLGDHAVLIGQVCGVGHTDGEPLAYHQGNFFGLERAT